MDILSDCLRQREILSDKLDFLLSRPFSSRNQRLIEVISDMIVDLDFAIAEMRKAYNSDRNGYRPRRVTLLSRADFYRSV